MVLDVARESVPAPWGPISSLHPRSIVREDKNKEEIKEVVRVALCINSTKNHCRVKVFWIILFVCFVTKNVNSTTAMAVPAIVTIKGPLFITLGTIKVGAANINFEKNQPETIVPSDRRTKALFRLPFSSLIGGRENILGGVKKQNTIIRNLYTAVSMVAMILKVSPKAFITFAPAASRIRSLE